MHNCLLVKNLLQEKLFTYISCTIYLRRKSQLNMREVTKKLGIALTRTAIGAMELQIWAKAPRSIGYSKCVWILLIRAQAASQYRSDVCRHLFRWLFPEFSFLWVELLKKANTVSFCQLYVAPKAYIPSDFGIEFAIDRHTLINCEAQLRNVSMIEHARHNWGYY
jgi:hypothetical protein